MDRLLMSSESDLLEEVTPVLHKLGLELEDLESLVSYPEDQTTPEKLPFIVNQIRLEKARRSLERVESQTDPEPSTSFSEKQDVNQTKGGEEELHQDEVTDHEDTSKGTGIRQEEISETGGSGDKSHYSSSLLTDVRVNLDPLNCELKNQSLNQPSQAAQVPLEDWTSVFTSPGSEILPTPPLKGSEPEVPAEPQASSRPIKVSQSGRQGIVLYDSLHKRPTTSFTEHVKEQQQKPRLNPSHPGVHAPGQDSLRSCNPSLTDSTQAVRYSTHVAVSTASSTRSRSKTPRKRGARQSRFLSSSPRTYSRPAKKADRSSRSSSRTGRSRSKSPRRSYSSESRRQRQNSGSQSRSPPCRPTREVRHTKRNNHSRSPAGYCRKWSTRQSRSPSSSPRACRRPAKKADRSSRSSSRTGRSHSKSPRRSYSSESKRQRQSSGSQSRSSPCRRTWEVRHIKRNNRFRSPAGYCHKRGTRSPSSSPRACRRPAKRAHRSSWSSSHRPRSRSKSPRRRYSSESQRRRQSSGSQSRSPPCRRTQEVRRTKRNNRFRSPAGYCRKSSARQSDSFSSSPCTSPRPAKRADRSSRSSSGGPHHRRRMRRSSQSPRQLPSAYIYRNSSRSRNSRDSPHRSPPQSPESPLSVTRRDGLRSPRRRSEGLDSPRQASPKKNDGRKPSPRRSERKSFRRLSPKRNKSIEPVTTVEPFIDTKVSPKALSDTSKQDEPGTTIIPKSGIDAQQEQEETSSRTNRRKTHREVKGDEKKPESLFEEQEEETTSTSDHQKAFLIKTTEPERSTGTRRKVDPALQKPASGPPQATSDDPFHMLLDLIRSTKEYSSRLRNDGMKQASSLQPSQGRRTRVGTSTKSGQRRPPNRKFSSKKDALKPKTTYLTSPVPEAEAAPPSAAVRFPTPGERFVMCLHRSPLQYVDHKTLTWSTDSVADTKVLLVKELPAYGGGLYSERDVADLFIPFGFRYPEDNIHNIYVFPEACMAFVLLPNMEAVRSAMDSASGRGLWLNSCRASLHVLDVGPTSMKPIQFYRFLMKQVGYIVTDGGKSTVYVENISWSEALDLREVLRGRVKNYLRLLNKVFIEMQCELDTDVLGVWFSLRRAHTYRFYRLKAPLGQAAALPPKPRVDSAADGAFLEAVVLPRIPSVPSGSVAPFWVTVTTTPFAFATLSPWFNVPDHVTISSELDVPPPQGVSAPCTIMLTGLPQASYQHADVDALLRPYLAETSPSTTFYSVNVLPLQCRAFVHFANGQRCRALVRDHLSRPLSVRGSALSVHLVLEDMELGCSEDALFVSLMRWSNAGAPRAAALSRRLVSVEVSQLSLDVLKVVMKEVASVAPFVNFLPLSNRIIVEMAEPGDVTRVLEESHFPAEVSAALSAESLTRRLQRLAEDPLPSQSSETEASPEETMTVRTSRRTT